MTELQDGLSRPEAFNAETALEIAQNIGVAAPVYDMSPALRKQMFDTLAIWHLQETDTTNHTLFLSVVRR